MVNDLITKLKNPVNSLKDYAESDDLKKALIRMIVVAAVLALVGVISVINGINKSLDSSWYSELSKSELSDLRSESIKEAELFDIFIKGTVTTAISIAVISATLFFIAKFTKNSKNFEFCLSIASNAIGIYAVSAILNLILSYIYAPLGALVLFIASVYASYSLIFAFRESLDIEDINTFVLTTTAVISVVVTICIIALSIYFDESISDITSIGYLLYLL